MPGADQVWMLSVRHTVLKQDELLINAGALFCLSSYATPHGGLQDMRDLLEQMAWQVRELGLHKIATSQLYPPQDMVQPLTAAFVYTDT